VRLVLKQDGTVAYETGDSSTEPDKAAVLPLGKVPNNVIVTAIQVITVSSMSIGACVGAFSALNVLSDSECTLFCLRSLFQSAAVLGKLL
jgi:hypothetical protein